MGLILLRFGLLPLIQPVSEVREADHYSLDFGWVDLVHWSFAWASYHNLIMHEIGGA